MSAFISIDYVEGDTDGSTYEQITVRIGNDTKRFGTGDPQKDYLSALIHAYDTVGDDVPIMGSSSLDHFMMDTGIDLEALLHEQSETGE